MTGSIKRGGNSRRFQIGAALAMAVAGVTALQGVGRGATISKLNTDSVLGDNGAWLGGTAPSSLDVAQFGSALTSLNTFSLGLSPTWGTIQVTNPASALTITDVSNFLTLTGTTINGVNTGIDMSVATQSLTLNTQVSLLADQTWMVGSSGSLTVTGAITGAQALTKDGLGSMSLGTNSTFTALNVVNGTFNIDYTGGATGNILNPAVIVRLGANISGTLGGGNLVLKGNAVQTIGTLTLGPGTGSSDIFGGGLNSIDVGTGTLIIGSLPTKAGNSNNVANTGLIRFGATGNITLNNIANSTLLGVDQQNNVYAEFGLDDFAATSSNKVVAATYTNISGNSVANTNNANVTGNVTTVNNAAVTFRALRFADPATAFTLTANNSNSTGIWGLLISSTSAGGSITGTSVLTPPRSGNSTAGTSFTVFQNSTNGDFSISNVIGNSNTTVPNKVIKAGPGRLILSGTNTYFGHTIIDEGTVAVSAAANLGGARANQTSPTIGGIYLNGGTLEAQSSFSLAVVAGTNGTFSRDIQISNRNGIINTDSGAVLTVPGAVLQNGSASLPGSLTKIGAGTLVLNNSGSYLGGTNLANGVLITNNSSSLGTGPLTVASSTRYVPFSAALGTLTVGSASLATTSTGDFEGVGPTSSDMLYISGNLAIASGATFNLFPAGGSSTSRFLSSGTFNLFEVTGNISVGGVPVDYAQINNGNSAFYGYGLTYNNPNTVPGATFTWGVATGGLGEVIVQLTVQGVTVNGVWISTVSGNWPDSANWSGGNVPGSLTGDTATFNALLSGPITVSLNGNQTVAALTLNSTVPGTSPAYTIAPGGNFSLTIDNAGSPGSITDLSGNNLISAPVVITATTTVTITSATDTVEMSGGISGAGNLSVAGAGILLLDGTKNTYNNTTIAAGANVLVQNGGSLGNGTTSNSGSLTLANNGSLNGSLVNSALGTVTLSDGSNTGNGAISNAGLLQITVASGNYTLANAMSGAGTITQTASPVTLFTGNVAVTGPLLLSGGTVRAGANIAFGNSTVTSPAILDVNAHNVSLQNLNGSGTVDNSVAGPGTLTLNGGGVATFSGSITNSAGSLTLIKVAPSPTAPGGTIVLTGINTYSGNTIFKNNGTEGAGQIVITASNTLNPASEIDLFTVATIPLQLIDGVVLANPVVVSVDTASGGIGRFMTIPAGGSATMSGTITDTVPTGSAYNDLPNSNMRFGSGSSTSTLTLTGSISTATVAQNATSLLFSSPLSITSGSVILDNATLNSSTSEFILGRDGTNAATILLRNNASITSNVGATKDGGGIGGSANSATPSTVTVQDNAQINVGTANFALNNGGSNNNATTLLLVGNSKLTLGNFVKNGGGTSSLIMDGGTIVPTVDSTSFMPALFVTRIGVNGVKFDTTPAAHSFSIAQALNATVTNDGGVTLLGTGTMTLSGGGNYTGLTTVNAGLIVNGTAGGLASGSALRISGSGKVDVNGYPATVAGLNDNGGSTTGQILNSNASPTAILTVNVGASNPNNSFAGTVNLGTGGLAKTGGGTLSLNGAGTAVSYSGNTSLGGGALNFGAAGSSSVATTLGGVILAAGSGDNTLRLTKGTTNAGLQFTSLGARPAASTINFALTGGTNGVNTGIVLSAQAAGFVDEGAFFNGADFAWVDNGSAPGLIRAPVYGTDAGTGVAASPLVSGAHNLVSGTFSGQPTDTVASVKFAGTSSLTLAAGATLSLSANGILQSGGGSSTLADGGGSAITSSVAGKEWVIRVDSTADSLAINVPILDNGNSPLSKSGQGTLTLGAANTIAGVVSLLGGGLNLANASALQFAILDVIAGNLTFNAQPITIVGGLEGNGPINIPGGTILRVGSNNGNASYGGGFSGTGTLEKIGTGVQTLTGDSSTPGFSGTMQLDSGTLAATVVTALGTGTNTLQFNGGTFLWGSGNNTFSPSNPIAINGNVTLQSNVTGSTGGSNSWSGLWSGNGVVTITLANATNLLSFTGNTTGPAQFTNFSGTITMGASNGTVRLLNNGNDNTMPGIDHDMSHVFLDLGTGNVGLNTRDGNTETIGALSGGSGTTVNGPSGTVTSTPFATYVVGTLNANSTFGGAFRNGFASNTDFPTNLVKTGSGKLTLTGNSIFTGNTTIQGGGILEITNIADSGVSKVGNNAANANLIVTDTTGLSTGMVVVGNNIPVGDTITGITSNTGPTWTLTLAVAALAGGTGNNFTFVHPNALGGSTNSAANLTIDNSTLRYVGAAASSDRLFSVGASGLATIDASGTGPVNLYSTNNVGFNSVTGTTITLTGSNTGLNILGGLIFDSNGPTSIVKTGTGTWMLTSGSNNYSGNTTVNSGALLVGNPFGSGTGTGNVTVNSTGTFGGTGSISGNVSILAGGHLAPGSPTVNNGAGTLTLTNVTLAASSFVDFHMVAPFNESDVNSLFGLLTLPGAGNVTLNLYRGGTTQAFQQNGTYNLFTGFSNTFGPSDLAKLILNNTVPTATYVLSASGGNILLTISGGLNFATWAAPGSGAWPTNANWDINVAPNAASESATFSTSIGFSNATVSMNGNKTLGELIFANTFTGNYTISQGSPAGTLTLNNSGINAAVTVTNGGPNVAVPVVLASDADFTNSDGSVLTISGTLTDNGGGRNLSFTNPNGSVGSGATVSLSALGDTWGGNTTVGGGITLIVNGASMGALVGNGNFQVAGGNTNINGTMSIAGVVNVTAGTLRLGGAASMGSLTLTAPGRVNLNGNNGTVGDLSGSGVLDNGAAGAAVVNLTQTDVTTFSGSITQSGGGNVSIDKSGGGTIVLTGSNTYAGGTTLGAGVIYVGNNSALGSGAVSYTSTGGDGLVLNSGINLSSNIVIGTQSALTSKVINTNGAVTATYSGTLTTLNGQVRMGLDSTGTLVISGTIDARGTANAFFETGGGTLIFVTGSSFLFGITPTAAGAMNDYIIGRGGGTASGSLNVFMNGNSTIIADNSTTASNTILFGGGNAARSASFANLVLSDTAVLFGGNKNFNMNNGAAGTVTTLTLTGASYMTIGGFTTSGAGTSALNLDGGTIVATQDNANFLPALTNTTVNILFNGGKFDTNSTAPHAITISSMLSSLPGTNPSDGGITILGAGSLTLATANGYTGPTNVNGSSTLIISANNNLGNAASGSAVNFNGGTLQTAATMALDNGGGVNARNISLGAAGGTIDLPGANTLTVSGVISGSGNLTVNGAGGTLLVTGAANIGSASVETVGTGATLEFGGGVTHAIGTLAGNGTVVVDTGTTVDDGPSSPGEPHMNVLDIRGNGRFNIRPNATLTGRTAAFHNLLVAPGGPAWTATLNLRNNNLIVGDATNTTSFANVRSQITQAAGVPAPANPWNVAGGITSSSAAAASTTATKTALGYASGAEFTSLTGLVLFDSLTFISTDTLIKYTLVGDANLDGSVNINDFFALSGHINQPGDWSQGDFNYTGTVNINDFFAMTGNFNKTLAVGNLLPATGGGSGGAAPQVAAAPTPEPSSLMVLGLASIGLLARRRRR